MYRFHIQRVTQELDHVFYSTLVWVIDRDEQKSNRKSKIESDFKTAKTAQNRTN